jgi:transglutaminase-like putative cysteine protease
MKLAATHVTRYWYSEPVTMCHTQTHLKPRTSPTQAVLEYDFQVGPQPGSISSETDYFGNEVTLFSVAEPHRELIITSYCAAELASSQPPDLNQSPLLPSFATTNVPLR